MMNKPVLLPLTVMFMAGCAAPLKPQQSPVVRGEPPATVAAVPVPPVAREVLPMVGFEQNAPGCNNKYLIATNTDADKSLPCVRIIVGAWAPTKKGLALVPNAPVDTYFGSLNLPFCGDALKKTNADGFAKSACAEDVADMRRELVRLSSAWVDAYTKRFTTPQGAEVRFQISGTETATKFIEGVPGVRTPALVLGAK